MVKTCKDGRTEGGEQNINQLDYDQTPFLILSLVCGGLGIAINSIGLGIGSSSFDSNGEGVVFAQPIEQRNLTTYVNKDYGFSIGHPSSWGVKEYNLAPHQVVIFEGPRSEASIFVRPTEEFKGLNIHEAALRFNFSLKNKPDLRVIESNNSTMSGFPALEYIYYGNNMFTTKKVMETMAVSNNTYTDVFSFGYETDPAYFDRDLPIAKEMLASMRINSTNE